MRKRENGSNDNTQLNIKILMEMARKNFERGKVDNEHLLLMNRFLMNVNNKLQSLPTQLDEDIIRSIISLIVLVEHNLAEQPQRHTYTLDLQFYLIRLIMEFFQKAVSFCVEHEKVKILDIINVFWPLFDKKVNEPTIEDIEKNLTRLGTVCNIFEQDIKPKENYPCFYNSVREMLSRASCSADINEEYFRNMMICCIRSSCELAHFESLVRYQQVGLTLGKVEEFRKGMSVMLAMCSSVSSACLPSTHLNAFFERLINHERWLISFNQFCKLVSVDKLYDAQGLFNVTLIVLGKIFATTKLNEQIVEALQTLADFSYSFFHVEGKDKNLTELPLKAVKWLIDRQGGRRNTLNKMEDELKQLEILVGNTLEESARKIDIKKKLFQQNSIVQELDEEEGSRQMTDLKKSCEYLNTIFINILSNAASSRAMKLSFDARLDHLEENLDESVVKLIFSVYPLIVSWPIDHSCRSKLQYGIMLRRGQVMCLQKQTSQQTFEYFHSLLRRDNACNYHFMMCAMIGSYLQDSKTLCAYLLTDIESELRNAAERVRANQPLKDNTMLIVDLVFLLVSLDIELSNTAIRIKTRQVMNNIELLSGKLNVAFLLKVQDREIGGYLFDAEQELGLGDLQQRLEQIVTAVNKSITTFRNYHLNLLYSLVVEANEVAGLSRRYKINHGIIADITRLRKLNSLSQFYTLRKSLQSELTVNNPNHATVFLLLLKLSSLISVDKIQTLDLQDSDSKDLMTILAHYLISINEVMPLQLLVMLQNLKCRPQISKQLGSAAKYHEMIRQGQMIKMYSAVSEQPVNIHLLLTKNGLLLLHLIKTHSQDKDIQQALEQKMPALRKLMLLYCYEETAKDCKFTEKHNQLCKIAVQFRLLTKKPFPKLCSDIVASLLKNVRQTAELLLQRIPEASEFPIFPYVSQLSVFLNGVVLQAMTSATQMDCQLFSLVSALLQEQKALSLSVIEKLITERLSLLNPQQLFDLLKARITMGLQRNAEGRGEIIKLSQTLYELIGKIPKKEELAEKIVEDIISRDEYGDASKSSYLLKEIMGVGVMVKKAVSEASTEKIFNYIMALLEVFPEESQLEIPRFICEFFSMRFKDSAQVDLSVLGAGDKQSSCRPQQAYRCLKCADKKLFCSGCATVCHKQHPTVYFQLPNQQIKNGKCQCREITHGDHHCRLSNAQGNNPNKTGQLISVLGQLNQQPNIPSFGFMIPAKKDNFQTMSNMVSMNSLGSNPHEGLRNPGQNQTYCRIGLGMGFGTSGSPPIIGFAMNPSMIDNYGVPPNLFQAAQSQPYHLPHLPYISDNFRGSQRRINQRGQPANFIDDIERRELEGPLMWQEQEMYAGGRDSRVWRQDRELQREELLLKAATSRFDRMDRDTYEIMKYHQLQDRNNRGDRIDIHDRIDRAIERGNDRNMERTERIQWSELVSLSAMRSMANEDQQEDIEFQDEYYEGINETEMQAEKSAQISDATIASRSYLLPKFVQLLSGICQKGKLQQDPIIRNQSGWKLNYSQPMLVKNAFVWRMCNPNSYHVDIKKENHINNMSCVLIKKCVAHNHKFILITAGTEILVHLKQRLFTVLGETKPTQGFHVVHRHSAPYQVHSVQFSPNDRSLFCTAGLHHVTLLTISPDGTIARTNNRFSLNTFYINKMKLAKMGIFIGLDREIKVLNYSCKPFLTIKTPEGDTLVREWCLSERLSGCLVHFVCPNGNIYALDVLAQDQGRKEFVTKVADPRKPSRGTGASVICRDLPELGRYMLASFKDGCNMLGRLQGDTVPQMTQITLKGGLHNLLQTHFILGLMEIVKGVGNEVYVVATAKKYFPPQMSYNQGYLVIVKIKKDARSEVQLLPFDVLCEYFTLIPIGSTFLVMSMHSDGSLTLSSPQRPTKAMLQEQLQKIQQTQNQHLQVQVNTGVQNEQQIAYRKAIRKTIDLKKIELQRLTPYRQFRESSSLMKVDQDYTIIRINDKEFEIKQTNFAKVIMGISLPQFGSVMLPTRTASNVIEVGFTNVQALYFYGLGCIRFAYTRHEDVKYFRDPQSRDSFKSETLNPRLIEKIQRAERLSQLQNSDMIGASNLLAIVSKEDNNSEDIFVYGKQFDKLRLQLQHFDQILPVNSDSLPNEANVESLAIIMNVFLNNCISERNFVCQPQELMDLARCLRKVGSKTKQPLFELIKNNIVLSMKLMELAQNRVLHVFNDEYYGLKFATEIRFEEYYKALKGQTTENHFTEIIDFIVRILKQDTDLGFLYIARYPGLLALLHKRMKKMQNQQKCGKILEIYCLGYGVLKLKHCNCVWVLKAISSIIYAFVQSHNMRRKFYSYLCKYSNQQLNAWVSNVESVDYQDPEQPPEQPKASKEKEQDASCDQLQYYYNLFSRGEINEEALIKIVKQATKPQNLNQMEQLEIPIEEEKEKEEEEQLMLNDLSLDAVHSHQLIYDLIDDCTENISSGIDLALPSIVTLYVVCKAADQLFVEGLELLLEKTLKLLTKKCNQVQGPVLLSYLFLVNRIITTSTYFAKKDLKNNLTYQQIHKEVYRHLQQCQIDKVPKISSKPTIIGRIFRGLKPAKNVNLAYGFAALLIPPCQPDHLLLSLECYWLLPEPKEFYAQLKCKTSIKEGIKSGDIPKILEIVKENRTIWQECGAGYVEWLEDWIKARKNNWQTALELLYLFYD